MMNGLCGDTFMLVHREGEIVGLNGSGFSGSRMTLDAVRRDHGDAMPQAGAATVSVSGALDGYLALHERLG